MIAVRDHLNLPSDIFVVTRKDYEGKKPLLRRFLAAYRDSAAWMIAKPDEAARLAVTRAINGRDEAINREVISLLLRLNQAVEDGRLPLAPSARDLRPGRNGKHAERSEVRRSD